MSLVAILLLPGLWRCLYGQRSESGKSTTGSAWCPPARDQPGADTAATILRQEGISDVEIVAHPIHKRVVLSRENFHGTSVAALGIAAHECGHAIQHKEAYAPLQTSLPL